MIPLDSIPHIQIPEITSPKKQSNLLFILITILSIGGIAFLIIKNKPNETI